MKRDETTIQKTAEMRCTNANICETIEQMKRQQIFLLIRLKQVYSLFGPSLVTRPGKCRKFQKESSMNDAQGAWIMMIMVS